MEYHNVPLPVSTPVMAMPSSVPLSGSVTLSSCPAGVAKSTSAVTSVPCAPTGATAAAGMLCSCGLFVASSTGAVLPSTTVLLNSEVLPRTGRTSTV